MSEGPKNNTENGGAGGDSGAIDWEKMAKEAAAERALREGNAAQEDMSSEELEGEMAYQKKLAEMADRGEDFDPLSDGEMAANETNTGVNAKGQEYTRMSWNAWDMYAREGKDKDSAYYLAHNAWNKRVTEVANKMEMADGESVDDYKSRIMQAAYANLAQEQADDPNRRLSAPELNSLRMSFPRQEGESTKAWTDRISQETGVRFGAAKAEGEDSNAEEEKPLSEREDFDKRVADTKERFEMLGLGKRENESDEDYEDRVKASVFSDVMTEMAAGKKGELNKVEHAELTAMYPRQEGESDADWAARITSETNIPIKIDSASRENMGVDDENGIPRKAEKAVNKSKSDEVAAAELIAAAGGEDESTEEDAEASAAEKHAQAEKARAFLKSAYLTNVLKAYKISESDIDNFSDEEALLTAEAYRQRLLEWATTSKEEGGAGLTKEELEKFGEDDFEKLARDFNDHCGEKLKEDDENAEDAEDAEAMEKLREAMIRGITIADLRDMLKAEDVKLGDLKKMDIEGLKDLQEKLRGRMFRAFGVEDMSEYLERDELKVADLKKLDFEGMKDQREVYRQEFIHDLCDESFADKLKEKDIKLDELKQMTMEELLALKKQLTGGEGGDEPGGEVEKKHDPLIAVMNNRERDARHAAEDIASEMFKLKLEGNGGKLGKVWRNLVFGQMLKDATMAKYRRLAAEAIAQGKSEVRGVQVGEYWSNQGDGSSGKVVERLTMAYVNGIEDSLLHSEVGNTMDAFGVETDENGNKVVYKYSEGGKKKELVDANSAEAKSTIIIRESIEAFASGRMTEKDFNEAMAQEKAKMAKEGVDNGFITDTLLETAKAAKERFNHEESMENIMEGFRLINADYQASVRSEIHRSKIDELSEKVSSKLGIMQPEVIAAAAGIAVFFTQKATSSVLRATLPVVGGSIAAGTFAGFKEHNRVAVDRADQARRLARGEQIGKTKYDKQMEATEYNRVSAVETTKSLQDAIESGDTTKIAQILAATEAVTQISDSRKIDLIQFSGGDNTTIEDERLALDVQIARAKVELKKQGIDDKSKVFVEASKKAYEAIESDISAKDAAFKKLQAKRVAAQVAKTAAMGVATAVVGQEVSAAFNPNSYGLFDKLNDTMNIRFEPLNIGVNNADAHKTLLAGWLGINSDQVVTTLESVRAAEATGAKLTDEQVKQLREEGYTVTERTVTTETPNTYEQTVSASEYARSNGVEVTRNWGGNGTSYSDGNELGLMRGADGRMYTNMSGDSFSNTMTQNFDAAAGNGQIQLAVSLTRDSQGTPIMVPGTWENGHVVFMSDDPAINEILANDSYAYASVVMETGNTMADGSTEIFSFATDIGSNSVGEITRTISEPIVNRETVYDIIGFDREATKIMEGSDLLHTGIPLPFASRKNLTRGKKGKNHGPSGPVKFGDDPTPPTGNNGGGKTPPKPPVSSTIGGGKPPVPPVNKTGSGNSLEVPGQQNPEVPGQQNPELPKPTNNGDNGEKPSGQQGNSGESSAGKIPERAPEDSSVITLTPDQVKEKLAGEEFPDVIQARVDYEIEKWNSLSDAQRAAAIKGDFSGFSNLESATMMKDGLDYLRKYGFITAPEPADVIMPDVDPVIAAAGGDRTVTRLSNDMELVMEDGAATIRPTREAQAAAEAREEAELRRAADNYEPISKSDDYRDIAVSDKRIAELNSNIAPTDDEIRSIRKAITQWNLSTGRGRELLSKGDYDAYGENDADAETARKNMELLRKYHIIGTPEAPVTAENEAA